MCVMAVLWQVETFLPCTTQPVLLIIWRSLHSKSPGVLGVLTVKRHKAADIRWRTPGHMCSGWTRSSHICASLSFVALFNSFSMPQHAFSELSLNVPWRGRGMYLQSCCDHNQWHSWELSVVLCIVVFNFVCKKLKYIFWNTFNVNSYLNIFLALQMKSDMPGLLQLCVTFTKNMLYILYISQYGHICIGNGSELSKVDWYISKSPWSENIHYYTFICFRSCQSTIKQYNIRGSAVILSLIKCVMPTL